MKRTIAEAAKKISDRNKVKLTTEDISIFDQAKRLLAIGNYDPDANWVPINQVEPIGQVLLKTKSGIVVIGDLYEGKWRVDGHWRHDGKTWVSDYKFKDMIEWRNIPI